MNSKTNENFKRLAEKRVNNALKNIDLIGNLSNRTNYSYTEADSIKIYGVLRKALEDMKGKFQVGISESDKRFKL